MNFALKIICCLFFSFNTCSVSFAETVLNIDQSDSRAIVDNYATQSDLVNLKKEFGFDTLYKGVSIFCIDKDAADYISESFNISKEKGEHAFQIVKVRGGTIKRIICLKSRELFSPSVYLFTGSPLYSVDSVLLIYFLSTTTSGVYNRSVTLIPAYLVTSGSVYWQTFSSQ